MTNKEAIEILTAKAECIRREVSGTDIACNLRNCDECELCYAQGTTGEQREALYMAISALREQDLQPSCNQLATDYISRQAAIDILYNFAGCVVDTPNGDYRRAYKASRHELETLPSAQPEIIRCKDCKHRPIEKDGEIMPPKEDDWKCPCLCDDYFYSWRPKDNFFCASGERRKE